MSFQQESRGQVVRRAPTGTPSWGRSSCQLPPPAGTCVGSVHSELVDAQHPSSLLAILLINCLRPYLFSPIKDSSKTLSFPRKGSCHFKTFPGSGGTINTVVLSCSSSFSSNFEWLENELEQERTTINTVVLSCSSSFSSHSKLLQHRHTQDSFSLKTGSFVYMQIS